MNTTMTKGRPRRRGAAMALLSVVAVAGLMLGASAASAAPAPRVAGTSTNPIDACKALVAGTAGDTRGGKVDGVIEASKTCATACGMISSSPSLRGRLSQATVDDARLACAAACDFIILEGERQTAKTGQSLSGPVGSAVQACTLLASSTEFSAGLPFVENSGRSWR